VRASRLPPTPRFFVRCSGRGNPRRRLPFLAAHRDAKNKAKKAESQQLLPYITHTTPLLLRICHRLTSPPLLSPLAPRARRGVGASNGRRDRQETKRESAREILSASREQKKPETCVWAPRRWRVRPPSCCRGCISSNNPPNTPLFIFHPPSPPFGVSLSFGQYRPCQRDMRCFLFRSLMFPSFFYLAPPPPAATLPSQPQPLPPTHLFPPPGPLTHAPIPTPLGAARSDPLLFPPPPHPHT
jgi:hypothetical protein